jgi:hypothetical protein
VRPTHMPRHQRQRTSSSQGLRTRIPLASTKLTTQHQGCQEILAGNKDALLGSLTPEQAKAVIQASSKLKSSGSSTSHSSPSALQHL